MANRKQIYPAKMKPFGSANGYPATGWFSMHITYPDTEYSDDVGATGSGGWEYGQNTQSWRQGLTVLIKTPIATAVSTNSEPPQPTADATNMIIVDLHQAAVDAAAAGLSQTYKLGTEEATRLIAAKINSKRAAQIGERGQTRYLRARYVKMSGRSSYSGNIRAFQTVNVIRVFFDGKFTNGYPADLPESGNFVAAGLTFTYDSYSYVRGPTTHSSIATTHRGSIIDFTCSSQPHPATGAVANIKTHLDPAAAQNLLEEMDGSGGHIPAIPLTITAAPPQHTIVISWELNSPNTAGGYWAPANAGPVFQGIGSSVPLWYLAAKPMDGGNMGLPAINADAKGGTALTHVANHGYVRFSIEGLNSCELPDLPPPDFTVSEPAIQGMTAASQQAFATTGILDIADMEYGTKQPLSSGTNGYGLWSGYTIYQAATTDNNALNADRNQLSGIDTTGTNTDAAASLTASIPVPALTLPYGPTITYKPNMSMPFYTKRQINTNRVNGLKITNEETVFESIPVIDDLGNELIIEGGSPFGTIIRDFVVENVKEDKDTGLEKIGPSAPQGNRTPNLRIQVPNPDEIPGGIFVRTAHDRVQAWSNMTWGMGGLSPPDPRNPGDAENNFITTLTDVAGWNDGGGVGTDDVAIQRTIDLGDVSQFDTHDRMLIFHCERILHPDMTGKQGLTSSITPGAVPSATTRLFSAHRITDHAERGAVLTQTANGADTGQLIPHSRIRFGRQGHSFVSPMTHRGTPFGLRRQLHRSHGSSYSLMFEAETENKHFGFSAGYTTAVAHSNTKIVMDTLETKGVAGYGGSTGSFSSEGLPMSEMSHTGWMMPNRVAYFDNGLASYTGFGGAGTGHSKNRINCDYIIAPGQEHTNVASRVQTVIEASLSTDLTISNVAGPTNLDLQSAVAPRSRLPAASEFMLNGFMLSDYLFSGGRPEPSVSAYNGIIRGSEWGQITPRVATELASVPPLIVHDPDYTNMAGAILTPAAGGYTTTLDSWDRGLLNERETNSGCKPDAFLCTWLAEYSHPALLGTSREHFMMFRYRESGMPRSINYPAQRGLLLRNHSRLSLTSETWTSLSGALTTISSSTLYQNGQAHDALPFERLYVAQWLQNYGYNGLNAGGHGLDATANTMGSASSVLMGHTTLREPAGTLRSLTVNTGIRKSRGEGIGDGISPEKTAGILLDGQNKIVFPTDSMVGYDFSRRLPVRAWGIRTASDALDMLAGDPHETVAGQQPVYGKGRFDGGIHDSVQKMPDATAYGSEWKWPAAYSGVERTTPIGVVMSDHTVEATPFFGANVMNNEAPLASDEKIGIGNTLGENVAGMLSPTALASGVWDIDVPTGSTTLAQPTTIAKGLDPFIPSIDDLGTGANSPSTITSSAFGSAGYHITGNALHTNAKDVSTITTTDHYPATGWGQATLSGTPHLSPIPLSEIADHRQVQSRAEPRLGLSLQTENERNDGAKKEYLVMGTKAASLHSDLIVGQHFPLLPSYTVKSRLNVHGYTTATPAVQPVVFGDGYTEKPTWTPDGNKNKAAITISGDTIESDAAESALDTWTVRGGADLPPWGGVFILRKTYLNRQEVGSMTTSITTATGKASASHPRRTYVDYIVRPVRPMKLYGFASTLLGDGWLHGARCSGATTSSSSKSDHFHRDKKYGVFEMNMGKDLSLIEPISSAYGAFEMEWPDANNHDVVWHLIPSTSMLQHFKSDAIRITEDNEFRPQTEARYSQTTHPGGSEIVSQSETRYSDSEADLSADHARQVSQNDAVIKQHRDIGRQYIRIVVKNHIVAGTTTFIVDDGSLLPNSGYLIKLGTAGIIRYTARTRNTLTIDTAALTSTLLASLPSFAGETLYFTNAQFKTSGATTVLSPAPTGLIEDVRAVTYPYPALPSLIDNAVAIGGISSYTWYRTASTESSSSANVKTGLSYRGLLTYDPSDFIMASQKMFVLNDGSGEGVIRSHNSSSVKTDGRSISSSFFPPYIFDLEGGRWRVSDVKTDLNDVIMIFRNIDGETLSDGGVSIGNVFAGQYGSIGIRTTDATMMLLNDAASEIAGSNLISPKESMKNALATKVGAHPNLNEVLNHSELFVSRNTRGLNIMEAIRNLSQFDGHQLVNENTGVLIYSSEVFRNTDIRMGSDSGARDITVNQMFDSPNEVIIEGEQIANNEKVIVTVQDLERMKGDGGAGSTENLVRTLRQEIPGLRTEKEALRLAKSLLSRVEHGAPLVQIMGMVKATLIQPGDIIQLNLPAHGLAGTFGVFEATHNYEEGLSDFVVAQYNKGIEGILSDIQASTGNSSVITDNSGKKSDLTEIALSSDFKIIATHRVVIRSNNNTCMIIGAKHNGGMGKIGVKDSNKRALPIGISKSRPFVVK